ncbi:hypothetical protein PAMA_012789 [Pampus argenteus]
MDKNCLPGQYWDALLKRCINCHTVCHRQQPHMITKCTGYCVSASCKALPGHYYDLLLKKCLRCAEVCGRHPAECSEHCQTLSSHEWTTESPSIPSASSPPATVKKLLVQVTSHIPNSRGIAPLTTQEDSTVLLYSFLALCMVLLLSSLCLALVVFLRGTRARISKQGPKKANHTQERVVRPGQEVGQPGGQQQRSSKDSVTNSSRPTDHMPSEDSNPTETCVCVHCFPDLTALAPGSDRPLRAPFSFYQQIDFQKAKIQNGGPASTGGSSHTSGLEVQQEAAVG